MPGTGAHHPTPADAVTRLIDEHGRTIYALAKRFCGSETEAEDLVQEVFLAAYKSWDQFRGESSEKTWLYRIAARACQRMHRKRAGEPDHIGSLHDLLPFGDPRIAAIASTDDDVLTTQVRAEARARLERAIAGLPDEFRVPVILKEIVGFPVSDIADILGLEEATARSRIHRARLKLRAAVDGALPRTTEPAPPPAYPEQTCLDLLDAKQQALDRGVPFDSSVICDRCRSVFATLDLAHEVCHDLANEHLPATVREKLVRRVQTGG